MSFVTAAVSPASAQAREFDDAEAQLQVRQAATAASAAARNVEALRKEIETERQRVVQTDDERDLNQVALKALEQELRTAETKQRELEAMLKAAQDARTQGLVGEAQRRKLENERRLQAVQPPIAGAQQLEELKRSAEREEAALRLDTSSRERLQVALTSLGFDTRGADGVFGPRSREMIAAWQKSRGQLGTGFLTSTQQQTLRREAAAAISKHDEERQEQRKPAEEKGRLVAIVDFEGDRSGVEIVSALRSNLGLSARLKILQPGSYAQSAANISTVPQFGDWRGAGVDFLVIGRVTRVNANAYKVDFRLFDTVARRQVVGLTVAYPPASWQQIAHIISDHIFKGLTGVEGRFEQRYCSAPSIPCVSNMQR